MQKYQDYTYISARQTSLRLSLQNVTVGLTVSFNEEPLDLYSPYKLNSDVDSQHQLSEQYPVDSILGTLFRGYCHNIVLG